MDKRKIGLDAGIWLLLSFLKQDFTISQALEFVLGDISGREFAPKLKLEFPYHNILSRTVLSLIFQSVSKDITAFKIFDRLFSNLLVYSLSNSIDLDELEPKGKDVCERHKWLWYLIGPCVSVTVSKHFESGILPKSWAKWLYGYSRSLGGTQLKLFENLPLILVSVLGILGIRYYKFIAMLAV